MGGHGEWAEVGEDLVDRGGECVGPGPGLVEVESLVVVAGACCEVEEPVADRLGGGLRIGPSRLIRRPQARRSLAVKHSCSQVSLSTMASKGSVVMPHALVSRITASARAR